MLQVVASTATPQRRLNPREAEVDAIATHISRICRSYDPLPPKDSPERETARQTRIKHMLQMVRPDWPDNPHLVPRLSHNEWLIAATNGVDRIP